MADGLEVPHLGADDWHPAGSPVVDIGMKLVAGGLPTRDVIPDRELRPLAVHQVAAARLRGRGVLVDLERLGPTCSLLRGPRYMKTTMWARFM